ncbi:MAG: CoA transferase [Dehalococcoidia bacterium]|nr:CoA transferase [Dehalococcoidia bacterium]
MTPGDIEDPDNQPPLKAPGHQADFMAGITGNAATMCAIMGRKLTGRGEHVDVSEQEPVVRTGSSDIVSQTHRGQTPSRIGRASSRPLRAKDGLYTVQPDTYDHTWPSFLKAMGNPEWAKSEMFKDRESRQENRNALGSFIEEWSRNYTKDELYQLLQVQSHIMYLPVNTIEDAVNHPQYIERGFFVEMDHPEIGKFKAPGSPYSFSATPWHIERPAPMLGQHNREVICDRLGYSKEDLVKMRQLGVI